MMLGVLLLCAMPVGAVPLESWDDKIPNAGTRFKILTEFNGEAVLDKETQLVWQQSPPVNQNRLVQCPSRLHQWKCREAGKAGGCRRSRS
jgi:hypothetical protein